MRQQKLCQIGTTGKGMPCMASIHTLAGLTEACEVCAPRMDKMRKVGGWVPFRGKYFMKSTLTDVQHNVLLDRINEAGEGSVRCADYWRTYPHQHCTECGSTEHVAASCDILG